MWFEYSKLVAQQPAIFIDYNFCRKKIGLCYSISFDDIHLIMKFQILINEIIISAIH